MSWCHSEVTVNTSTAPWSKTPSMGALLVGAVCPILPQDNGAVGRQEEIKAVLVSLTLKYFSKLCPVILLISCP